MAGIISHKIVREIAQRRNAQITFIAIGPFSFEGRKAGLGREYGLLNETKKFCAHLEIMSNSDLLNGNGNISLHQAFAIADQKIVEKIGQLI